VSEKRDEQRNPGGRDDVAEEEIVAGDNIRFDEAMG